MLRRTVLRNGAVAGLVSLAGCGGLPIVGCSPPNVDPPDASFRLEVREETEDGQIRYEVINEGPATFDETNTSRLRVQQYDEEGNLAGVTKLFDAGTHVPDSQDPGDFSSLQPVESGSGGPVFQDVSEGWQTVRVEWAPESVDPDAPPCRLRVLREWTEPPSGDPHF